MDDPRHYLPLTPQQFHILLALTDADRHGYGIILEVAARTDGSLRLGTGTLYTALARLLALGLVVYTTLQTARGERAPRAEKDDERRRYYALTPLGRSVLAAETSRLDA